MGALGPTEIIVVGIVAILLFGKNLPDVARKLGNSYEQFRKGLQEIKNDVNQAANADTGVDHRSYKRSASSSSNISEAEDDFEQPRAPRFPEPKV